VLHRFVQETPGVTLRDGCAVEGLLAERTGPGDVPLVTGVRVRRGDGGEEAIAADLVVDAGGRRSRLAAWLRDIGAPELREDSEPCGIFYCSRFYRFLPGATRPRPEPLIGADLGYLKYGIFHGDSGIFSLTFAAPPEDAPLRALLRTAPFEAAARALPLVAPFVEPDRAEPITDVHGMGNLRNTRRHFVERGLPRALGLVPIGDAAIHTNPMYGRGCSFAVLHAYLMADALRAHPDDSLAFARALDEATEREIVPWYRLAVAQDRDAMEVARRVREGDPTRAPTPTAPDGPVDPKAWMRDLLRHGLVPALRSDATVLRAFLRGLHLLDPPGDLMKRPELLTRILEVYQRRHQREEESLGPDRAAMLAILAEASGARQTVGAGAALG